MELLTPPMLAFDVGSSLIKMALIGLGSPKVIKACDMEVLPSGVISDGVILKKAELIGVISGMLRRNNIFTFGRRVSFTLGGSSVIVKRVNFPKPSGVDELGEIVHSEAEQHFQTSLDSLYFDFAPMRTNYNPNYASVLLAAARKETVDSYHEIAKALHLRLGLIDVGAFSLLNTLEFTYGVISGTTVILDVGGQKTRMILSYDGDYLYSRDMSFGIEHFATTISDQTGENLKAVLQQIFKGSGGDESSSIRQNLFTELYKEVQSTLQIFYQTEEVPDGAKNINQVYLTGGGARIIGLAATLKEKMGVKVEILLPFSRFDTNQLKNKYWQDEYLFGSVIGVGMRKFEFID